MPISRGKTSNFVEFLLGKSHIDTGRNLSFPRGRKKSNFPPLNLQSELNEQNRARSAADAKVMKISSAMDRAPPSVRSLPFFASVLSILDKKVGNSLLYLLRKSVDVTSPLSLWYLWDEHLTDYDVTS